MRRVRDLRWLWSCFSHFLGGRFDDGCGCRFGGWSDAYRTRVRWVLDAAFDAEVGHCWAGRNAVSDQAAADARICVQSDCGFRDGEGDQGEVMLCQVCLLSWLWIKS